MTPRARSAIALLVAATLIGVSADHHRESLERGNALFRAGRVAEAEAIYRDREASESVPGFAAYNLGTALLALGSTEAEIYLRAAAEALDQATAQHGHYNLSNLYLVLGEEETVRESRLRLLAAAASSARAALRLDPRDDDARWNLALAAHLLDALGQGERPDEAVVRDTPDEEDGGIVILEVARAGARAGEFEAFAGEDPGSLNRAEALALVDLVGRDAEPLIRGILWSRRPRITPWAEPYPGGDW